MAEDEKSVTLFLCGDVMTGRGVDQVLPHPSDPTIHERYMRSARGYVKIARDAHGPIPEPVEPDYAWGHALDEFERFKPSVKLINLETAITQSDDDWQGKGVNYRMHPQNIDNLLFPNTGHPTRQKPPLCPVRLGAIWIMLRENSSEWSSHKERIFTKFVMSGFMTEYT
jgi:poly-gamma-glutamate capsule biosynthesis protein CapA/YwtB (metallophosphatase superfamily)